MPPELPPLRLVGASVLRDGQMQSRSVAIDGGRISKGPLPAVNLEGYYILPGIIDLHGDAFERHLVPRPGAEFDLVEGLASADREAAANGVTTAWFAQGWSWEGARRGPDHAEAVLCALDEHRRRALIDIRVQLRCETHLVEHGARLIETVRRHKVGYVVFNDHLPEAVEVRRSCPEKLAMWAHALGRSLEEYLGGLDAAAARSRDVPRHLCTLAAAFDRMGVVYGSHDDPDGETRERFSMIGARIAEFPTTRRAAAAAKAMNDPVLMGAPNVVRGGSQSGNIAATDLIKAGLCDALVSDYYYPALTQAVWTLVDSGLKTLPEAWAMISARPAQILRLPDRGVIDHGKRADLTIVHAATRRVEATIAGGRLAYLAGEAGRRFLAAPDTLRLAAE